MDTLHDRLTELADDAPTGGAPAAELWGRGKRAYRLRAAALAATLLVVGVGAGIGVRLGDGDRSGPAPVGTVDGIALPIEYPVGEELPDLGDTPGPLAAVWLAPRMGGGAPEAVGLVAETGTFGTLPIDLSAIYAETTDVVGSPALSPDGRRIAYTSPTSKSEVIVHDLVSGENYAPPSEFKTRSGYTWIDATHLVGHVAGGTDGDGWLWEPGTAPKLANPHPYLEGYGGKDFWVYIGGGGPQSCSSPVLADRTGRVEVPVLCDVLGFIGSEFVLGHWNSDRLPGGWDDPSDGNGTVVAVDIRGVTRSPFGSPPRRREVQFDDPVWRHVVVSAGAPERVTFASDLIGEALDADGGAS